MKLRQAVATDSDQLFEVHTSAIRELCPEYYTAAEVAAWSGRLTRESYERVIDDREFIVCDDAGSILGFGQLDTATGEVEAVYVRPASTRRGVGSALLQQLETIARRMGLRELHLDSSLNAEAFYERAGFRRVEPTAHRLTPTVAIACVYMTKVLTDE